MPRDLQALTMVSPTTDIQSRGVTDDRFSRSLLCQKVLCSTLAHTMYVCLALQVGVRASDLHIKLEDTITIDHNVHPHSSVVKY